MHGPLALAAGASGDSTAYVFPLVIGIAVTLVVLELWALVDVLSWPRSTWEAAGLSRRRWVGRVLLLGLVGAWLYLRAPRRDLKAAYADLRWRR